MKAGYRRDSLRAFPAVCSGGERSCSLPPSMGAPALPSFSAAPEKLLRPTPFSRWQVPEPQGDRGQPEAGGADSRPLSGTEGLTVLGSAHAAAENTLVWPGRG